MRRILPFFAALGTVLCLHADVNPSAKARSIFRARQLVFETQDGKTFTTWSPEQRIVVGHAGWEMLIPGAARHISMSIVGAHPSDKPVRTEQPVPTHNVYLKGAKKDWTASTTGFRKVRYPEVLPGVDVAYYGDGQKLEFDFIVEPGANPDVVRLRFAGQDRLEVDPDGELRIYAGASPLIQKLPAVYQMRKEGGMNLVDAHYVLRKDGQVGFSVGAYDHSLPLVIDPVVDYTYYLGNVAKDVATNIVRDRSGFLYVGGTTLSTGFPVYGQAAQNSAQGDVDVFLTKIDPNASPDNAIVYSSFIGGSAADNLSALMVDNAGFVYMAGNTFSTNFPTANAAYGTYLTNGDGFVLKLDTTVVGTGGLVYSTYLGGTNFDAITGAVLASDGSVAVAGYTQSTDFPLVGSSYQNSNAGSADAFVAYFGPGGNLAYTTYLGGSGSDRAQAIALDDDGGIVISGLTASRDFPNIGPGYQVSMKGLSDVFIAKLTLLGELKYSSYFGGGDLEEVNAMARYAPGQFAITGYTTSIDLPVTGNYLQRFLNGPSDAFVAIFDVRTPGANSLVYSTLYGGSGADAGFDIKVDANGLITLAGYTISNDLPVTSNAIQPTFQGGGADSFLTQFKPGSPVSFATYLGGKGTDIIYSIALDPNGRIFAAGSTNSRSVPTGNPAFHFGDGANTDALILGISPQQ